MSAYPLFYSNPLTVLLKIFFKPVKLLISLEGVWGVGGWGGERHCPRFSFTVGGWGGWGVANNKSGRFLYCTFLFLNIYSYVYLR